MFRILLTLFIIVPILEIYLLIQVGEKIGLFATLATIVLTAIIGASLVRREGIKTLNSLQARLNNQELPGKELADGAMLLLAGVLLVTPGFFTDGVGFFLAFPISRALLRNSLISALSAHVQSGNQGFYTHTTSSGPQDNSTIEGEFQHHDEQPDPPKDQPPAKLP
ncbi:MAG: FxsA family protein [Magnetococcales bacterium]|nr:FxsA family protein [Magnetococcales bacterium]